MRKKLVVIDDDPDARLYYATILDDLNLEIIEAANGEEGIRRVRGEKPDLVLLDLMMPKKGGLAVFNEIMDDPELKNTPVIIISGATSATGVDMKHYVYNRPFKERKEGLTGRKLTARPIEYLDKPIEPEGLLRAVKKILGGDGKMAKLTEEVTLEYLKDFLQYGEKIEKMEKLLEEKGKAIATEIETLEELEGESRKEGKLYILKNCPMVPVLEEIMKVNEEITGVKALPGFYSEIVEMYMKKHQGEESILHPLCIVHQHIRRTFGKLKGLDIQQIACRSSMSGKTVVSSNGLRKSNLRGEKVKELLKDSACLYMVEEHNHDPKR